MAKQARITTSKGEIIFHSAREVLDAVAASRIDLDQASQAIDQLSGNGGGGSISAKVSEKGAISIYGLQRMPVTLYVEQWERLIPWLADNFGSFVKGAVGLKRKASLKVQTA